MRGRQLGDQRPVGLAHAQLVERHAAVEDRAEHAHLVERGEQVALHGDAVADAVPARADLGQVDADPAASQREGQHAAGYPAADDEHR